MQESSMEKLIAKKAGRDIKTMSIFVGLIASFVFIIPVLSVGNALDKAPNLQEIISKAKMRQQFIKDNVSDATFMGKTIYKELDKDLVVCYCLICNHFFY